MPSNSPTRTAAKPVRQAKQARAQATVAAVVEAAARILAESGWARLTTNAIAKRAGVSIGSVYEYFPDKAAIVHAIADQHLQAAERAVSEAALTFSPPSGPQAVVRALVDGFVRLHGDDPRLHRALSQDAPLTPDLQDRAAALRERVVTLVATALAGHVGAPGIKAAVLVDAADAITHRWLVDDVGTPVPITAMAHELETMFAAYLAAGPPTRR